MNDQLQPRMVHVVATVDLTEGGGDILYVNPSNVRSNAAPTAGMGAGDVVLVLRDAGGAELGRIYPEIRYDACADHEDHRQGLIQHDVELPGNLAAIELVRGSDVLDRFSPEPPEPAPEVAAGLTLGAPLPEAGNRRDFGAGQVAPRKGVTYLIQARPDNAEVWNTLSIGRSTPEFQIDKNQFPGARTLTVRVIQNAGFDRRTVDERVIPLD